MTSRGLKWYFCLNQGAKNLYQHEIRAAVNSAIENTNLRPHFIYDGTPDDLTEWLEARGVKVIYHKASFASAFDDFVSDSTGAFLRIDVPIIETEDDFILYTDTDVIFNKNIILDEIGRPELFSASTQIDYDDWFVFNSGVMIMNVKNMKAEHKHITDYIYKMHKGQIWHRGIQDQEILNDLYLKDEKYTKLNQLYNHKPYWGINKDAYIVHYHGPKPYYMQQLLDENTEIWSTFQELLNKSFMGYKYYYALFEEYCSEIHVDINTLYNYLNTTRLNKLVEDENKKRNRLFKIKLCKKIITFYTNKITVGKTAYN
jgi:lipopolysaccharide biosynthesis glycosyltransferase